jgi:Helix-hairpin-helix domain
MSNADIAHIFERMSRVLALKGKDRFRIIAYENAARALHDLDRDLSEIAAEDKLAEIPGIGKDLAGKIAEAFKTGCVKQCEGECRGIPDSLLALFEIRGLGPKTIALLHRRFHVNTVDELQRTQSGVLMSSRLMPPTVGSRSWQNLITSSGLSEFTSRSKTSTSAKRLKSTALPSMTGFPANGPIFPKPSTLVPFVTTATRFPRVVYSKLNSGDFAISRQGSATPGVYAKLNSFWVRHGLVGTTSSFPLRPQLW